MDTTSDRTPVHLCGRCKGKADALTRQRKQLRTTAKKLRKYSTEAWRMPTLATYKANIASAELPWDEDRARRVTHREPSAYDPFDLRSLLIDAPTTPRVPRDFLCKGTLCDHRLRATPTAARVGHPPLHKACTLRASAHKLGAHGDAQTWTLYWREMLNHSWISTSTSDTAPDAEDSKPPTAWRWSLNSATPA